ncbi:hypothetical protein AGMMS49965_21850 [Bacteroidia bacterium]|nr:hypothetical protein AGMMS49965_21850 [Bacteroidia bacterium]
MKYNNWNIGTLLVGVLLFAGCNSEGDLVDVGDRIAVQFTTSLGGTQTRIASSGNASTWEAGDRVGIFMVTHGGSLAADIAEGADNMQYTASTAAAASGLAPVAAPTDQTIFYPPNGSAVDFIACYPYKATGTGAGEINDYKYPVDVSNQADPAAIDLLYAGANNSGSGYTATDNAVVSLPFAHLLSRISLTLTPGTGMTAADLAGATVRVTNLATQALCDLNNGTLGSKTAPATVIFKTATDGRSSSAIVIPQTTPGTSKLTVTLTDGSSKEGSFAAITWEAGYTYPYTIQVSKAGTSGITLGNWQSDGTTHTGTIYIPW